MGEDSRPGPGRPLLLAGVLPLRYCSAGYACRVSTWGLPSPGQVVALILHSSGSEGVLDRMGDLGSVAAVETD